MCLSRFFFFQAEDGIRDRNVTGVQTCALPISFLEILEGRGEGVMARLDPFIDLIFKEGAEVLLLETGAPAAIVKGDKIRPAMARSLTTAQIAGACAELVPAYQRETFTVFDSHDFEYQAPGGRVRCRVEPSGEGV